MPRRTYGKLIYDPHSEEGMIEIDWVNMPDNVMGLDILSDWLIELNKLYHGEVSTLFNKALKPSDKHSDDFEKEV
jgi:hypothetical protein